MVIEKFKWLLGEFAENMREHPKIDQIGVQKATDVVYGMWRANLIDLIVELSQGASVDWDELNATMKDWR